MTEELAGHYSAVRGATEALCAPLSPEDCAGQSMPLASPAKWHLAHTTWFFETFLLAPEPGYRPFDPNFRFLFNSYYNAVGEQHPQARRGLLTRPSLERVLEYRDHVDEHLLGRLSGRGAAEIADLMTLGLHHEQQHQELIVTDVKHLLSCNPLKPAYFAHLDPPPVRPREPGPISWKWFEGGEREIGFTGEGFCFDNETPRHRVLLDPFELASRPTTNAEFMGFMSDGGYERPELWLSEGWTTARAEGWRAPAYWEERDGEWWVHTLAGLRPVRGEEPVCHVSFFEADAYASWAAARLPSEAEWERAAEGVPVEGQFLESGELHPAPAAKSAGAPVQLFGDVWEWPRSPYGPYPGFRAAEGALGEYNGKFMSSQMVLRGGSCATPRSHIRASYRNFFSPPDRWQFTGVRLARDV